ncbi:MAG TPA: hypothetical protein VGC56_07110 [Allosphingosinicella sp.]|jgi:hypothetical protein
MLDGDERQIAELVEINLASLPRQPLPVRRCQHPKHHGCVSAVFRVRDGLPPQLRTGVFAEPRSFDALVRFSNGRAFDDRVADAHGMAIKLLGVTGRGEIGGHQVPRVQDFVLVDSETFFTGEPKDYARVNHAILGTGWSRICAWAGLVVRPWLLLRLRRFVSSQPRSPLEQAYYSTVPFRLGAAVVKYAVLPREVGEAPALSGIDGLAEALRSRLARGEVTFDFLIDIQTDDKRQPVDDPSVSWSRSGAERVPVAELTLSRQRVDPTAPLAENLQFSPWHCLPEHKPLGYINRARLPVYRTLGEARHAANGVTPLDSAGAPDTFSLPLPGSPGARTA